MSGTRVISVDVSRQTRVLPAILQGHLVNDKHLNVRRVDAALLQEDQPDQSTSEANNIMSRFGTRVLEKYNSLLYFRFFYTKANFDILFSRYSVYKHAEYASRSSTHWRHYNSVGSVLSIKVRNVTKFAIFSAFYFSSLYGRTTARRSYLHRKVATLLYQNTT